MITIAFFNNKGGVGKSSGVINVAHALTKLGKANVALVRVLVVDCDSQRNTFRFFSDESNSDRISSTRYENIDIRLGKRTYISLESAINADEREIELFEQGVYDYIILDLPPALTDETKDILSGCDYVFVPIELGTFAIQGIANVTEAIAETGARFGGCFVSKFDRENPADHELDELLRQKLGSKAMRTRIPCSRVIKNSISYRQTAFEYMEWTSAAEAYMTLTQEILGICEVDHEI